MTCALFCIKDLTSLLSFWLILRYIFKETPKTGKWRIAVCAILTVLTSVPGFLFLPARSEYAYELLDFIATVIALISIPLLFRKPRFWRAFAVLFIYFATIDTLWSFLVTFFEAGILQESVFNIVLTCAVSIAVYKGANHNELNVMAGAFNEIPVWLLISLFLFELTNYYKEFGVSTTWYNFFYVISSCLIFISILYLVFRVFRLVYTQNSILKQLNEQLVHEKDRMRSDEELRQFRHDFKNHTTVINSMLEQGDFEGAKSYFSSLTGEVGPQSMSYSTGNSVVDSLLNIRSDLARRQNTCISFDGAIPSCGVEPKDICVCFGNLLDNAIEACASLPPETERAISIKSILKNNTLYLSFANPTVSRKKVSSDALPTTTKKDVKAHGIGLKNVSDMAKKYYGSLHLSVENGMFIAELLLKLNVENNTENEQ